MYRKSIKVCRDGLLGVVLFMNVGVGNLYAQGNIWLSGKVYSEIDGKGIPNASVTLKNTDIATMTDSVGAFRIPVNSQRGTLIVRHVAFKFSEKAFTGTDQSLRIRLEPIANQIQEVEIVNTGYYQLPKERATGSFDYIDEGQLQRFPFTNLIDRLEGVTNGLLLDRSNSSGETTNDPGIRLRGLSTIESNSEPLIILDGFIYDGHLSTISPSDIASVTVLKDAAAASIWGAKAGNGVLVINTKQAKRNQKATVSFSSVTQIQKKPDLYYSQHYLPSSTVLDIEESMFQRNNYRERDQTPIPLYTEWLIRHRDGEISTEQLERVRKGLEETDTREEALKHLYRSGVNQHYDVALQAGGDRYTFRSAMSYDKNRAFIIGNKDHRWNANLASTIYLSDKFRVSPSIFYTEQGDQHNGVVFSDLSAGGVSVVPYYRLMDEAGNASAVVSRNLRYAFQESAPENGLLDWLYRPLDERDLVENSGKQQESRLQLALNYDWRKWLTLTANYQYVSRGSTGHSIYDRDSYYVRDLVNRFTQPNGEQIIPHGGIKRHAAGSNGSNHTGRMQLAGQHEWSDRHRINYVSGMEILHQRQRTSPFMMVYDYDSDLLTGRTNFNYLQRYSMRPSGTGLITSSGGSEGERTNRFISYYSNISYGLRDTYLLSGSIRWDASNIYGVKTNQRGVPLWSLGAAWQLAKEPFFSTDLFRELKLRVTYGSSGNTNPTVTTYPIISFAVDGLTNAQVASLLSVGNPSLSWERVNTFNVGTDFASKNNIIRGSFDYYFKRADNLIGADYMDPTTGIVDDVYPLIVNRINYANLSTRGWELQLHTNMVRSSFQWTTSLLMSGIKNEVTNYSTSDITAAHTFISRRPPVIGQSLDVVYAFPWNGLDNEGKPIIYQNGVLSKDYIDYYNSYPIDQLKAVGSRIPTLTANLMNTFKWKGFHASISFAWKSGYYFQRSTMSPLGETNGNYHQDYFRRWEKAGDEALTDVLPRAEQATPEINAIGSMHALSEHLWEKGDHIRIRDVSLGYDLGKTQLAYLNNVAVRIAATNLGTVWMRNKYGIDPDFARSTYPSPRLYSFSLSANF